jgi:hypothetical protein
MASRIPTWQRQVAPQVIQAPRVQPVEVDASGLAQGINQAAGAFFQVHQKEVEDANRTALLDADNSLGSWQNSALYDPEKGAFTKQGKGALGISQSVLAQFDEQQQGIHDSLANDQQKTMFKQASAQRRASLEQQLSGFEFKQQQAYKDDVDKSSLQLSLDSGALSYNDPQAIAQNRLKGEAVLETRAERLGWSPEEKEAQRQQFNSQLSSSVIQRMVIDSPQKARGLYEDFKGSMTADDQIRATATIDQAFKRQEAEARQRQAEARQQMMLNRMELQSRAQDAQAAFLQGLNYDNPPNLADFKAAYGDKAQEHYQSFKKVEDIAPAIRELATAAPDERMQILSKFKPAADGTAHEGFAEDNQLYNHLATVGAGLLKQQQADPGAYVMQYAPNVRQAYEHAQQEGTPEAHQAYVDATRAEQQRLGVQAPQVLPKAAADQLAATFNQQIAAGGTENAANLIEGMQQQWGKNFGAVIQQVGNKLPAEAQVIATGLPKDLAERMAAVAPISTKDLHAGLAKGDADLIQQAVSSQMADFATTLQHQAGGISTYNTLYQAAVRTATADVLRGEKPDKAAQKVVAGMVTDKYEFAGTYRIPKSLNTDAVMDGASAALSAIKGSDLLPLPGLKGVTPEENARQLESAVRAGGEWVTNNDESGLTLVVNGYALRGKDGKPYTRTWQQLTAAGIKPVAEPSSIGSFVP